MLATLILFSFFFLCCSFLMIFCSKSIVCWNGTVVQLLMWKHHAVAQPSSFAEALYMYTGRGRTQRCNCFCRRNKSYLLSVFPPLYFLNHILQQQYCMLAGHSRTIVGAEELHNGNINLLLFDPGVPATRMEQFYGHINYNLMQSIRKTANAFRAKQYQIVVVTGVLEDTELEVRWLVCGDFSYCYSLACVFVCARVCVCIRVDGWLGGWLGVCVCVSLCIRCRSGSVVQW